MQIDNQAIELAGRMADAAGGILRRHFAAPPAVERKADHTPVTEADREVETALRKMIEAEFPDHGIIGEEYGAVRPGAPWQWVLDPLDGTRAFIAGFPTFTTLIALAYEGRPLLGVIDQPVLRQRWLGVPGQATTCNGAPVKTAAAKRLEDAVICTGSIPDYFSADEAAAYQRVKSRSAHAASGGDAYGYAQLASGRIGLVIDNGLKPYDFCALLPVIEGAGGIVTDWQGKPLTLASDGHVLAAGNKGLHGEALKVLPSAT